MIKPIVIRVELDDCIHGGASCTIYQTWSDFEATQFRPTREEALTAAVAQWRKHRRFIRRARKEVAMSLESDPIVTMARQLEADIAAERAQSLAKVAARFYTDEPDNDVRAEMEVAA